LRGNYSSNSAAVRELKGKIFNRYGGRCCLCGNDSASTLDHYLPQGRFPEFSILPVNLMPACSICNTNKGAGYEQGGLALYLHCYFDELPVSERFLVADVECRDGGVAVDYRVDPPTGTAPRLAERIHSHFAGLRLDHQYVQKAANALDEIRLNVARVRTSRGSEGVGEFLRRDAESVAFGYKTINHWRVALMQALADHQPYCDGVCS
jgi:hypothetical protein